MKNDFGLEDKEWIESGMGELYVLVIFQRWDFKIFIKTDRHPFFVGSDDRAGQINQGRICGYIFQPIDFDDQIQIHLCTYWQRVGGFKKCTTGADILGQQLDGFDILIFPANRYIG